MHRLWLRIRNQVPNAITLGNLALGVAAIWTFSIYMFSQGMAFLFAAACLDVLDGALARLLHAQSPLGKDLDSLADLVSFGVAPATLLFFYTFHATGINTLELAVFLFIPVSSALRLAHFNQDSRQTKDFMGVPTPFNALYLMVWILAHPQIDAFHLPARTMLLVVAAVSVVWLHLPMRLFSLKSFQKSTYAMRWRIVFLLLSGCCILALGWFGALVTLPAYLLFSLAENRWP